MVSFKSPHTQDIPATGEAPRTREGGPAPTMTLIARCFVWPWVILFALTTLISFASAIERPDLDAFIGAFVMLMLCVASVWGMHRFLAQPRASIIVSAAPDGLFHRAKRPKHLNNKVFDKSDVYSRSPEVADAVIKTQPRYANSVIAVILSLLLFYVALPKGPLLTHREKTPLEAAVGTTESIRAALASYAADSPGNTFPAAMASWKELTSIVNPNGATLKNTAADQGFDLRRYTAIDRDGDRIFESYTMSFLIDGIPDTRVGRLILVSPSGIEKAKP